MVSNSELEALELLVKAGRVLPNVSWIEAAPQSADYVIDLANRILTERGASVDNLERSINLVR